MKSGKLNENSIILLLLYIDNKKSIVGKTKFQKIIFLYEEECHKQLEFHKKLEVKEKNLFDFYPHYFGPFSNKLLDFIKQLKSFGLIEENKLKDNSFNMIENKYEEKLEYKITELGSSFVETKIINYIDGFKLQRLNDFKSKYSQMMVEDLIRYVYTEYEEMTKNSLIKEKVLGT